MPATFLLYGSYGFVGDFTARLAVQQGLRPILAGRSAAKVQKLAAELGLECRVFSLDPASAPAVDQALQGVAVVLHCAGPYLYTSRPMADACLRAGVHYLDLTGEIPVYQALAARDAEARVRGVMLLPGVGFDVVPTDCLAVHLHRRLPSATRLTLAFRSQGPAGLPPGTQRTLIEMLRFGNMVRRDGRLETPARGWQTRRIDFGAGPRVATRLTWGDIFTAYYSTGIPNIEVYAVLPKAVSRMSAWLNVMRPLFRLAVVRRLLHMGVRPGSTAEQRARTKAHVWGEVEDDQGRRASARLHGPDAAVTWTALSALAAVQKVLAGHAPPGFQTPALAYGPDFVLECPGVQREDL